MTKNPRSGSKTEDPRQEIKIRIKDEVLTGVGSEILIGSQDLESRLKIKAGGNCSEKRG